MKRGAILEVVTPHSGMFHSMPGGLAYTDQMLAEAGLGGQLGQALADGNEALWLRRCLAYLERRFQRWLRIRLISPLSWPGLGRVIRYRIRTYPTFIMGGETYTGHDLGELEAFIREQVSFNANDSSPA